MKFFVIDVPLILVVLRELSIVFGCVGSVSAGTRCGRHGRLDHVSVNVPEFPCARNIGLELGMPEGKIIPILGKNR